MERPVRAKFNTQIYEEACEWFIECRAGDLDDIARAEFDRWLRKSPEHQSAYLEIAALWNEGPTLDPANRWTLDALITQAAEDSGNVVALERAPRPNGNKPQPISNSTPVRSLSGNPVPRATIHTRRALAIAASLMLVMAALATYLLAPRGIYATTLGEQRSLALNDGSTVQLNSLSKIRIHYTDRERTVDLIHGQALFHVAKDTARPFIVFSGQTRVRAVGTQFDVYRKADGTTVTVVEGRVAILGAPGSTESPTLAQQAARGDFATRKGRDKQSRSSNTMAGADLPQSQHYAPATLARGVTAIAATDGEGAIFLGAGEQITVTPQAAHRTLHPNLAGATAWTQRELVFDSASLADVAEEFNRYNERKLIIDPSVLGNFHISGVFSSTDPASLIRFLRDRPGLRVTETPAEIRIEEDL
jgi:transmembrane sensor